MISKLNRIYQSPLKSINRYYNVVQTSTSTVFTTDDFDPQGINYSGWRSKAKHIFSMDSEYMSPKSLNYQLPRSNVCELAFIGRSNVGKSSLIAKLLGKSGQQFVRISKSPGCTRTVNFFALGQGNSKSCYLVDLPGYGFAKRGRSERKHWQKTMEDYVFYRDFSVLRRTYVLIDIRMGFRDSDINILNMMSKARIPHQLILTKADLVSHDIMLDTLKSLFDELLKSKRLSWLPFVHVTSSATGEGIEDLQDAMTEVISQNWRAGDTGVL